MRVLVHDYGGYAFPIQLSAELARRGHTVGHAYCTNLQTTPLGVGQPLDGVSMLPVSTRRPLDKYNLGRRWLQEREYGQRAATVVDRFAPEIVLSANAPLSTQARILRTCKRQGIPLVYWLQDLIGEAALRILPQKSRWIGPVLGRYLDALEARLLRASHAVVSISGDFGAKLRSMGVAESGVTVIENWGTLGPCTELAKAWAHSVGLDERPLLLYAGTLSLKHSPQLILQLSQTLGDRAWVVVVSHGAGADWLRREQEVAGVDQLRILPYQDVDRLPSMYASADILLALLTADAGRYSVPSKVLTCMCAGRPILASMPGHNLAARVIREAGAGYIVEPGDHTQLTELAATLVTDADTRRQLGARAAEYAKSRFDIAAITDRFERVLTSVCP